MRIAMVFVHGTIFETSNISILKKNRINATAPDLGYGEVGIMVRK